MSIGLLHLSYSQLFSLPPFELRIFVEVVWYALNAKVTPQKEGRLSIPSFVAYAIGALRKLGNFLRTVLHLC